MINEDYCSYEVAKLLKEKGFNEPTWTRYEDDNEVIFGDKYDWNNSPMGQTSAPTHQLAMKWLREEKNILLYVYPVINLPVKDNNTFYWRWDGKKKRHDAPHIGDRHNYESPEQAVEAALKYVLENLI